MQFNAIGLSSLGVEQACASQRVANYVARIIVVQQARKDPNRSCFQRPSADPRPAECIFGFEQRYGHADKEAEDEKHATNANGTREAGERGKEIPGGSYQSWRY